MREDEVRAAARNALAETEQGVDVDAAWAALVARPSPPRSGRSRRWVLLAGVAVTVASVGGGGLLLLNRDDQVRTVVPSATSGPSTVPPTRPSETVTSSSSAPTTIPATAPATAPTTSPPMPPDSHPLATATAVAATPNGVVLRLDDGSWVPTEMTDPATGPAYLVGKFVVYQPAHPDVAGTTAGPIIVISKDGAATSGSCCGELLDAGWVAGRPTMLVRHTFDEPDGAPVHDVELTDAQDGRVTHVDRSNDALRTVPVSAAGIADEGIVSLRTTDAETTTLRYSSFVGEELLGRELPPGRWELTVQGATAWVYELTGPDGAPDTLTWIEFDLSARTFTESTVSIPALAASRSCAWTRFDGGTLQCDGAQLDIASGALTPTASPGGFVTPRRGPLPAGVEWPLARFLPYVSNGVCTPTAARSREQPDELVTFTPFNLGLSMDTYQFIGSPGIEWGGPFALVGILTTPVRAPDAWPAPGDPWPVSFEGVSAFISLPGERQAYVRSWGLDEAMIRQLIGGLTLRPADAPIPAFDYDPALGPAGMDLVYEAPGGPVAQGASDHLLCLVERPAEAGGQLIYHIVAYTGDPLWHYFAVLDRPRPVDIGRRGGALIVVAGMAHELAPTVDDVVDAPDAAWLALLDEPYPY